MVYISQKDNQTFTVNTSSPQPLMAVGIRKVQQKELSKSAIVLPTFQEETNVLADLDFMLDSEMNLDKIDQQQNVRHNPKDYRHCSTFESITVQKTKHKVLLLRNFRMSIQLALFTSVAILIAKVEEEILGNILQTSPTETCLTQQLRLEPKPPTSQYFQIIVELGKTKSRTNFTSRQDTRSRLPSTTPSTQRKSVIFARSGKKNCRDPLWWHQFLLSESYGESLTVRLVPECVKTFFVRNPITFFTFCKGQISFRKTEHHHRPGREFGPKWLIGKDFSLDL